MYFLTQIIKNDYLLEQFIENAPKEVLLNLILVCKKWYKMGNMNKYMYIEAIKRRDNLTERYVFYNINAQSDLGFNIQDVYSSLLKIEMKIDTHIYSFMIKQIRNEIMIPFLTSLGGDLDKLFKIYFKYDSIIFEPLKDNIVIIQLVINITTFTDAIRRGYKKINFTSV